MSKEHRDKEFVADYMGKCPKCGKGLNPKYPDHCKCTPDMIMPQSLKVHLGKEQGYRLKRKDNPYNTPDGHYRWEDGMFTKYELYEDAFNKGVAKCQKWQADEDEKEDTERTRISKSNAVGMGLHQAEQNIMRTGQQYTLIDFIDDGMVIIKNGKLEISKGVPIENGEVGLSLHWSGTLKELISQTSNISRIM